MVCIVPGQQLPEGLCATYHEGFYKECVQCSSTGACSRRTCVGSEAIILSSGMSDLLQFVAK